MDTDMQLDRTGWCWVCGTRDTEKDTDMQPDTGGQRGQNGVGFVEQEIQKRIQICSQLVKAREDRMVLGL